MGGGQWSKFDDLASTGALEDKSFFTITGTFIASKKNRLSDIDAYLVIAEVR
jgi:hypothetical protein